MDNGNRLLQVERNRRRKMYVTSRIPWGTIISATMQAEDRDSPKIEIALSNHVLIRDESKDTIKKPWPFPSFRPPSIS